MLNPSSRPTARMRCVFFLVGCAAIICAEASRQLYGQTPAEPSVSWRLQTALRMHEANASLRARDTDLSRMIKAYRDGKPSFFDLGGREVAWAKEMGLPAVDWDTKAPEPPFVESETDGDELISVSETVGAKTGTRATTVVLRPVLVARHLSIGVEFSVVPAAKADPAELQSDLLFATVRLEGMLWDTRVQKPQQAVDITHETFIDFWSETSGKRISLAEWSQRRGGATGGVGLGGDPAYFTTGIYGPLLYDVLAAPSQYVLIGNRKIALSVKFRKGCEKLCEKVKELRAADGQPNPPRCK